jgi:hypothetical protein
MRNIITVTSMGRGGHGEYTIHNKTIIFPQFTTTIKVDNDNNFAAKKYL